MFLWQVGPPLGVPPRTDCPSTRDTAVTEFGLTLVTVVTLLAFGYTIVTALSVPLLALLGVRAVRAARLSSAGRWLRHLLGQVLRAGVLGESPPRQL
jgi:hypothetical protein